MICPIFVRKFGNFKFNGKREKKCPSLALINIMLSRAVFEYQPFLPDSFNNFLRPH